MLNTTKAAQQPAGFQPVPTYLSGKKKRIAIAMSGGVDSATAALLLKQKGHEIFAIFMKNWEEDDTESFCHSAADLQQAEEVCTQLSIPLRTINFSAEYWDEVFQTFIAEVHSGLSPNPDILCNEIIKFNHCLEYARSLGADLLATGHYAGIMQCRGRFTLHKGTDDNKEQSYFLYRLSQEALRHSLFPLAQLKKTQVRKLAAEYGLKNAKRRDSYGICFIGERKFATFLKRYCPHKTGDIVSDSGQTLGQHDGICYYTIGQRRGLGIGGNKKYENLPWYVASKNPDSNQLVVVCGKNHPALYHNTLTADKVHWIDAAPDAGAGIQAKVRYRQADQLCRVTARGAGKWEVRFADAQRALTAGQHVVFYAGRKCLGGGVIRSRGNIYNQQASQPGTC